MRNQTKYLYIYICVLCLLIGSVVQLAQAQDESSSETSEPVVLAQAQLDQILAPIALYCSNFYYCTDELSVFF